MCECDACTEEVWNTASGTDDGPIRTCGQRIEWVLRNYKQEFSDQVDACRRVAQEFPCDCGRCDPNRCGVKVTEFKAPDDWIPPFQPVAPPKMKNVAGLYCYPWDLDRTTYGLWDGKTVQAKQSDELCGPGFNHFSNETIRVEGDELTLSYANQQASEVRVVLPNKRMYGYGKYEFSVKSIQVLDAAGNLIDDKLPKDLVLGFFSWDDTEDYAVHENWNHEVDIEISRWGVEDNADVQFLTQPPGFRKCTDSFRRRRVKPE